MNSGDNVFWVSMGGPCREISAVAIENMWKIAANHISNVYRWKLRQGVC